MYRRLIDLPDLLSRKSLFLLGPRQTGKSTLIRTQLPAAQLIDLLDSATYRSLSARPERLVRIADAAAPGSIIAIDEIQRVPDLLSEVHGLIERRRDLRFLLTGSSARKLRQAGVNLLGGRASRLDVYPLVSAELQSGPLGKPGFERQLQWGGLPPVVSSPDPAAELSDYVGLYLREEIEAEARVRSLPAFSRFLEAIAACNAEQLVFANVSRDAEVPVRTVSNYVELLEDSLIATVLPAYRGASDRKARSGGRFFFFDVGLANALQGRFAIQPGTAEFGHALEHLVLTEVRAAISYQRRPLTVSYWRTHTQLEVDFVVDGPGATPIGIEVKAAREVTRRDARGLLALGQDVPSLRKIIVAQIPHFYVEEGIEVWPIHSFLTALWRGDILGRAVSERVSKDGD